VPLVVRAAHRVLDIFRREPLTAPSARHPAHRGINKPRAQVIDLRSRIEHRSGQL
jgi:hypothetical protein